MAVRLNKSLTAAITDISTARGCSRSDVLRDLLTTALTGDERRAADEIERLRAVLDAIDNLPAFEDPSLTGVSRAKGYAHAMRRVKALLHPEEARRER